MSISATDLSVIRELFLNLEDEVCGHFLEDINLKEFLIKKENVLDTLENIEMYETSKELENMMIEEKPVERKNLHMFIDSVGVPGDKENGICQHRLYTRYIFHTHNIGLLAYPSPEDIVNMLKFHRNNFTNNYPHTSLVFTEWGIWEIGFTYIKYDLENEVGSAWYEYLIKEIKKPLDHLFNRTGGKGSLTKNDQRYIRSVVRYINSGMNNLHFLQRDRPFRLSYKPWYLIKGDYKLKNL